MGIEHVAHGRPAAQDGGATTWDLLRGDWRRPLTAEPEGFRFRVQTDAHKRPDAPTTTGATMWSLLSPAVFDRRAVITIAADAAAKGTADRSAT